jgi:predicted small metal-binding protein
MLTCSHPDCSWRALAPSEDAALDRYAAHLVAEHARTVDADLPEDTIEVRLGDGDDAPTTTIEAADGWHPDRDDAR